MPTARTTPSRRSASTAPARRPASRRCASGSRARHPAHRLGLQPARQQLRATMLRLAAERPELRRGRRPARLPDRGGRPRRCAARHGGPHGAARRLGGADLYGTFHFGGDGRDHAGTASPRRSSRSPRADGAHSAGAPADRHRRLSRRRRGARRTRCWTARLTRRPTASPPPPWRDSSGRVAASCATAA